MVKDFLELGTIAVVDTFFVHSFFGFVIIAFFPFLCYNALSSQARDANVRILQLAGGVRVYKVC